MSSSLLRRVAIVTALVLIILQAFVEAQATQSSGVYSKITAIYDIIDVLEQSSPNGRTWSSTSTSKGLETTYGRVSTVRLLTTTNDQGQPQTFSEATTELKPYSATGAVASDHGCAGAICTESTTSTTRTAWRPSGYVSPVPSTAYMSPTSSATLSATSVMKIFFGATSASLVLIVGVFLVASRRRRRIIPVQTTKRKPHSSGPRVSGTTSEIAAAHAKPELHTTEKALYEIDGRQALPEADGVERLADGEFEDKHATGVAREREGRGELPEGQSNAGAR